MGIHVHIRDTQAVTLNELLSLAPISQAAKEVAELRSKAERFKRQRNKLLGKYGFEMVRETGFRQCEGCEKWMDPEEPDYGEDCNLCRECAVECSKEALTDDELLTNILLLTLDEDKMPAPEGIASWSPEEREEVVAWASAIHFTASDNEGIEIPPKPAVLE